MKHFSDIQSVLFKYQLNENLLCHVTTANLLLFLILTDIYYRFFFLFLLLFLSREKLTCDRFPQEFYPSLLSLIRTVP